MNNDMWGNFAAIMCPTLEDYTRMKEVLERQNPVTIPEYTNQPGTCPRCKKTIEPYFHPNFCGYCGQKVRWES